ncbi:uncharacterized protein LOC120420391 [Culex pipiens pallens]|uniref:uncharacterized protein LOC120420391 n=1 Tax=Culex pipiens pallens TaxID=42434 RepID=UPI0022AA6B9D|nr:uncharacterized protein LOC120420391 [Culex pipiens pallens]
MGPERKLRDSRRKKSRFGANASPPRLLQKCLLPVPRGRVWGSRSEKAEKSAVNEVFGTGARAWPSKSRECKNGQSYWLAEQRPAREIVPADRGFDVPGSGILDRHAPATIGGTEPLRGRSSGQATASTTPLWHAIPQRRCETIARTHTHTRRNKPKIDSVHTGLAPLIPQSDWRSDKNWRTTWKKHTKRGTQRAPFFVYRWKICSKAERSVGAVKSGRVCSELAFTRANGGRADQVREESSVAGTANVDRRGAIGVRHRS